MTIRPATQDDIPALARIVVAGLNATYDGLVDPAWLAAQNEDTYAQKWAEWLGTDGFHALVSCDDSGAPVAVSGFGKLKTPPPGVSHIRPLYTAEIYAIYVMPDHWRQGRGTQLMHESVNTLRTMNHRSLCLWALETNKRAGAFYTALGGQRIGKRDIDAGSRRAKEICFGWRDSALILTSNTV